MLNIPFRSPWVEINLDAVENNTHRLKALIGTQVELLVMVKANAYGHGAVGCAPAALRGGATWLGVFTVGEGLELRAAGIATRILVAGPTPVEWMRAAFDNDLTLTAVSVESARELAEQARSSSLPSRIHLKVDTGMSRLGVSPAEVVPLARELNGVRTLEIEGIYTHLAVADTPDARGLPGWGRAFTRQQFERFRQVLADLDHAGVHPRYRHIANSPATLNLAELRLNLVRSGILVYGLHPSSEVPRPEGFEPALAFKTRLALIREAPRGTFVGYGCTFETSRDSRIGVILVGYADGFRRSLGNLGQVLVCGRRAPIVGRVCMDQAMIDVTDIPEATVGDEVVLIGKQGAEEISAEEVGGQMGTNNYETVTTISARVPRAYKKRTGG